MELDTNPSGEVSEAEIQNKLEALLTKQETEETQEDEPETVAEEKPEESETPPEDDSEDVEWEGDVYRMPKKIKEALLRHSDYTRKTQEVAEQRKSVEQRAEMLAQREKLMAAGFDKAVELREIDARLAQYKQLDWAGLVDQDPAQATKLNIAFQHLQQERQAKLGELQKAQQDAEQLTQKERQQLISDGMRKVKELIPSFNAEMASAIKQTTKGYGFNDAEIDQLIDPRFVHVLHDAHQWRKLQAGKTTVAKKVESAKPVQTTARTAQSANKAAQVEEARKRLGKTGKTQDAEALFERLLTRR